MQPIKREGYETLTAAEDAAQRLADFLFSEGANKAVDIFKMPNEKYGIEVEDESVPICWEPVSACWPHQPNRTSSTMRWL